MARRRHTSPRPGAPLTTEQVARLAGVTRVTVHRWLVAGQLSCSATPGGHRRVLPAELLRFLRATGRAVPAGLSADVASGRARPAPRGAPASTPQAAVDQPPGVLIMDDDAHGAQQLAQGLAARARGRCTVAVAQTSLEALLRAVDERPRAIVMAGILYGLDAVRACRALKAFAPTRGIAIVAVAAQPALEAPLRRAGADAFLPRPAGPRELLDLLDALGALAPRVKRRPRRPAP